MARAKKDYRNLTIKLDRTVSDDLEQYCAKMGQTKTTAIERILSLHFKNLENQSKKQTGKV